MRRHGGDRLTTFLWCACVLAVGLAGGRAQAAIKAPVELRAEDAPNDPGEGIRVHWRYAETEPSGLSYRIERRTTDAPDWQLAGLSKAGSFSYLDQPIEQGKPQLHNGRGYAYRVSAVLGDEIAVSEVSNIAYPAASWFHFGRINILAFFVLFFGLVVLLIERSRRGGNVYIRPIAGLKALEEAVGRATEMGKPVFFMPGIDEANNIQTLYGMVILQHVTRLVAAYETPLIVAVGKAFVVPLAQETVRQGYLDAGRPDLYKPDIVRYYSDEQFATVTAVAGLFVREKPATNLYFGSFYAESLILAETGFVTGAVQIAGTGNVHQLPFFVVACDYALVGEEFFAVSAYLSKDAKLLGSLKAMDLTKACLILLLVAGALVATFDAGLGTSLRLLLRVV